MSPTNPPRHLVQSGQALQTPSQTIGPFFAYGLAARQYNYPFGQVFDANLALPHAVGEIITLQGHVYDGDSQPVLDALVEISHADSQGRYPASREAAVANGFVGFGRCGTGTLPGGLFQFHTVMPGATQTGAAACIDMLISMRGLLRHLVTRVYFAKSTTEPATDPVMAQVPPHRQPTLIAHALAPAVWHFDVHLQGPNETVFFEL